VPSVPPSSRLGKRRQVPLLAVLPILLLAACRSRPIPDQGPNPEFLHRASAQHLRVMSFNVGWDSIFSDADPQNDRWRRDSKPAEFVRIVKAIDPDVICLQEINPLRDPQHVGSILDAAIPLGNGKTWQTHSGQDNVIAARFDLVMRAERLVHRGNITRLNNALALVDLPDANYPSDLYLICAHFRSQGGQENIEARQEHADAIVGWIRDIRTPGDEIDLPANTPMVVLGDLNVYDTDPAYHLTTLLTGDVVNENEHGMDIAPDWDDTSLADALPRHNASGDEVYTWRDDTQEFNPGALDRILYTDSVITVSHGFVLNTTTMPEAQLAAAGLQAGDVVLDPDTGRYDHLPVVVDIAFRDHLSRGQQGAANLAALLKFGLAAVIGLPLCFAVAHIVQGVPGMSRVLSTVAWGDTNNNHIKRTCRRTQSVDDHWKE
jgi:endonuclease/exonuclease/phosphatase family metal-dependent hydrolase